METISKHDEVIPYWESFAITSRYVSYTSEIEKGSIWKAHSLSPKPTTALEIGCEGGRWSKLLSDVGWRLICTDIDQRALNICKSRIPSAICIQVSSKDSHLHCDSKSIGLVLCIEVPEVINAEWFPDEAFRVLQDGGMIVGVFFNRLSWRGLIHQFAARLRGGLPYVYRLSYPAWRKSLHRKGFSMVHEEGFGWSPFPKTSNSILVPIATRIEHYLGLSKLAKIGPLVIFIARKD